MKKAKKAIGNTKAVTNKGKATTAATAKSGPKPAVMNRRKYNEAISGDTMSNYAMYKKGGKVKKYQSGREVDSVDMRKFQNTNPNASNFNVAPASTPYDKQFRDRFIKGAENYRLAQEREKQKQEKKRGKVKSYQSGGLVDKVLTKTEEIAKRSPTAAKVMSKIGDAAIGAGKAVKKYGPKVMEAASKMERGPKFKSGGSKFPDLTGDGKVTQADILKGRGVFKKGGSAKKKK